MDTDENRVADSQAVDELQSMNTDTTIVIGEPKDLAEKSRPERRRQRRQARKSMRGFGSVFRIKWLDKKTGEFRYSPRYSIKYYQNGEPIRELTNFTNEADAWKLLKKRHAEIAAGRPVGPDVER